MTHSVALKEITHIESIGHCRVVHTANGSFDERQQSLSSLQERLGALAPGQFISPCRGYIVNQSAIRTITAQDIQLCSEAKIPIRRGEFRKIRDAYFQWVFQSEGEV